MSNAALDLEAGARGVFVKLAALEVIDLVASSTYDFAVVDLEHSQLDEGAALRLVRHAAATGLPALVRLPEVDRGLVNRLLEAGAVGIQLSTVRRVDQVTELRSACRYAPRGNRSISLAHPLADYGGTPLAEYVADQGDGPLVVIQIETATTEDSLDDILASGPDVVFVGVTDLTVDLEFSRSRLADRIGEIASAAERHRVPLGGFGIDDPRLRYDVSGSDVALLRRAMTAA